MGKGGEGGGGGGGGGEANELKVVSYALNRVDGLLASVTFATRWNAP